MNPFYQARIDKALEHIDNHLHDEINVSELASLSGFSQYHFHRLFKGLTGETPYEVLLRLRLEKAIFLLKYRKELKISQVGYESGFSSAENFSRQFKAKFGVSPSNYRREGKIENSRIYQDSHRNDAYLGIDKNEQSEVITHEVYIEKIPEISIAYTKGVYGEDGSGLVEKYLELIAWAEKNKVKYQGELTRFGMSIDIPEITPASKFRYDFALTIDSVFSETDEVSFGVIPAFDHATLHVMGDLAAVAQAWDYLYIEWLPHSSYLPVHYPAIEEFIQGPEEIGWERFNIKCRIPVIKM